MIAGGTRGGGGPGIVAHLLSAGDNEVALVTGGRGLLADAGDGLGPMVDELAARGARGRTRHPLIHVHANPDPGRPDWTAAEWDQWWRAYEQEFGLEAQPYVEVSHRKRARDHRHRLYLAVLASGRLVSLSHDYARREKLARTMEFERGDPLVRGLHSRAVHAALIRDGREDVAAAMAAAGLLEAEILPALRPEQRAQGVRTGVDPRDVERILLGAWRLSDSGEAFRAALAEQGLRLAHGCKALVVVDPRGGAHPLAAALGRASKASGLARIGAAEVRARLEGLDLPAHRPEEEHDHEHDHERPVGRERRRRRAVPGRGANERAGALRPQPAAAVAQGTGSAAPGDPPHGRGRPGAPEPAGAAGSGPGPDRRDRGAPRGAGHRPAAAGDEAGRADQGARLGRLRQERFARARPRIGVRLRDLTRRVAAGPDPADAERMAARISPFLAHGRIRVLASQARGAPAITQVPDDPLETDREWAARRARWFARVTRERYSLGFVPEHAVVDVLWIREERELGWLVLGLRSGAQLVDRGDELCLLGAVDGAGVDDLVRAVRRKSWDMVALQGSEEFRRAAARRLMRLEPPIAITGNPLSEEEQRRITFDGKEVPRSTERCPWPEPQARGLPPR